MGVSMGAYAIWRLITLRPQSYGAIVVVSGCPRRISSSFGILRAKSLDQSLLKCVDMPVWIFHGRLDIVAPCDDAIRSAKYLIAAKDVQIVVFKRYGHVGAMRMAFKTRDLYVWIDEQLT
jgi:predicted peptidase